MSLLHQPHDKFFREAFSRPRVVAEYIRQCFPAPLCDLLHTETLVQQQDTYVDEALQKHITDVVYRCQYGEHGAELDVTLIFEHKSYPDNKVFAQVLRYLCNYIDAQLKDWAPGQFLRPVLAMVIYHGQERWEARSMRDFFGELPPELARFLPFFDFLFDDIGRKSEEELLRTDTIWLRSTLAAFKADSFQNLIMALEFLARAIDDIEKTDPDQLRYIRTIFLYLGKGNLQKKEIMDVIEKVGQPTGERFVSLWEALFGEKEKEVEERAMKKGFQHGMELGLQEGIEKGIEQGIEQGIEKGIEQGIEKGIEKGIERGFQIGKMEESFHVFRNGLREGVSADLLIRLTGVAPEQATQWKALLDQKPEVTWEEVLASGGK